MSLTERAARAMETGRWDGVVARAVASFVAPLLARGVLRPGFVPAGVGVVCVGGATLGGSGKTRVAVACARELGARRRVVLVGHAYRASPRAARVVLPNDRVADVGDEALVAARALAASDAAVVVGPTRQVAIDRALTLGPSMLVIDGPLRLRGRRDEALSILAVDALRPWGSGRLPPAGDLRAPRERLLAEADLVVAVDPSPREVHWSDGRRGSLASLEGKRLGLFTAMARPDRLVRALAEAGIRPATVISARDHGPAPVGKLRRERVDAWIGTAKCVLHLEPLGLAAPVGALLGALELGRVDAPLARALDAFAERVQCASHLHGVP